jgi:hypothetical protein
MFEIKSLNFGFVILCLEPNPISLFNTVKSLRISHPNYTTVGIVPSNTPTSVIKEMKTTTSIYKGKSTVTSMLNTGMKYGQGEWLIFLVAGTWIKIKLCNKLSRFIEDETDVLFPIMDNVHDFKHSTLNGLCIHKNNFEKIGPFDEIGELSSIREKWSIFATAINNCKFKAIAGAKIC